MGEARAQTELISRSAFRRCRHDDGDTVHYGKVVERVISELKDRKFNLLEALAEHVCGVINNDFRAPWVRLSVAKLGHIRNVRRVGVTLERRRAA